MTDSETARHRSPRRRGVLVALVLVAIATPVLANLATPDRERTFDKAQRKRLPYVDGYVKEATNFRVVVEGADGIFQNLETKPYLSPADVAHLQDHSRYGTPTRIRFARREGRRLAVSVEDLPEFAGVGRAEASDVTPELLDEVSEGDSATDVVRELGPPLEVRFDHTGDRDCWLWPTPGSDAERAQVCFTTDSRQRVLRTSMVEP